MRRVTQPPHAAQDGLCVEVYIQMHRASALFLLSQLIALVMPNSESGGIKMALILQGLHCALSFSAELPIYCIGTFMGGTTYPMEINLVFF